MSDGAKLAQTCGRAVMGHEPGKCVYWRGGACADPEYCVFQVKKPTPPKPTISGIAICTKKATTCLLLVDQCCKSRVPCYFKGVKEVVKSHPTCKECKYWSPITKYEKECVDIWAPDSGNCCAIRGSTIHRGGDRPQCRAMTKL